MQITTVGLDIAKNVFQVHGADAQGRCCSSASWRAARCSSSSRPCRRAWGLEACGAAHYWARELTKLGHQVRLMPPQYVRPYVKTNKHDAADAEACCEAVQRPGMRFVPAKDEDQQAMLVLHRVREQLLKQRTATINALRSHLAEFGIVAARRQIGLRELLAVVADAEDRRVPPLARELLESLVAHLRDLERRTAELDRRLVGATRDGAACERLTAVPGVGPVIATALVAAVGNAKRFTSGRHLAAWLGLVPRQRSSGGKERLLGLSKRATATCGGNSCTAPGPWCGSARGGRGNSGPGSMPCWAGVRSTSSWPRSPTSWHGSSGPCSAAARPTVRRRDWAGEEGAEPFEQVDQGFGLIGRSCPERLPRAARANVEDGMNGRTGVGGARYFPRAKSPKNDREPTRGSHRGRRPGPSRPNGWQQPRPECQSRRKPLRSGRRPWMERNRRCGRRRVDRATRAHEGRQGTPRAADARGSAHCWASAASPTRWCSHARRDGDKPLSDMTLTARAESAWTAPTSRPTASARRSATGGGRRRCTRAK